MKKIEVLLESIYNNSNSSLFFYIIIGGFALIFILIIIYVSINPKSEAEKVIKEKKEKRKKEKKLPKAEVITTSKEEVVKDDAVLEVALEPDGKIEEKTQEPENNVVDDYSSVYLDIKKEPKESLTAEASEEKPEQEIEPEQEPELEIEPEPKTDLRSDTQPELNSELELESEASNPEFTEPKVDLEAKQPKVEVEPEIDVKLDDEVTQEAEIEMPNLQDDVSEDLSINPSMFDLDSSSLEVQEPEEVIPDAKLEFIEPTKINQAKESNISDLFNESSEVKSEEPKEKKEQPSTNSPVVLTADDIRNKLKELSKNDKPEDNLDDLLKQVGVTENPELPKMKDEESIILGK